MLMVRDTRDFINRMTGSPVDSKPALKKLHDAGIDTTGKAYQVVLSDMSARVGSGIAYTNPTAIKNRMMNYDSEGNFIPPATRYGVEVKKVIVE